jgi:hypothetical protein
MNSQFCDPLPLDHDGRKITAKGPLAGWTDDFAPKCEISVVLTQDGHSGHGTSKYGRSAKEWRCDVERDDGEPWDPTKPVDCEGTITMDYAPPDPDPWPKQTVTLTPHGQ